MGLIRVLIVDDHTLFRRGIAAVLGNQPEVEVVGEASDGGEAITAVKKLSPDVVLMDLNMPRCNGVEATRALQADAPKIKIIILTVSDSESDLFTAIKYGAKGYLLKNTEPEELMQAIVGVSKGEVMVTPVMAAKLLTEFNTHETGKGRSEDNLSKREDEVLQLVAKGATNKAIAESLFISENTVKTHLQNIMEKLHLSNRSQAAAYAVKREMSH